MRMSLKRAFFVGPVVNSGWSSCCARHFWEGGVASVVVLEVEAVQSVSSVSSAEALGSRTNGGDGVFSSDECDDEGVAESSRSWSISPSSKSLEESSSFPVRGLLESTSNGLLTTVTLSRKWKTMMRREPRWSLDEVQKALQFSKRNTSSGRFS